MKFVSGSVQGYCGTNLARHASIQPITYDTPPKKKIVSNLVTKLIKTGDTPAFMLLFFGCWIVYWLPRDKDEVILIVWVG